MKIKKGKYYLMQSNLDSNNPTYELVSEKEYNNMGVESWQEEGDCIFYEIIVDKILKTTVREVKQLTIKEI